MKPIIAAFLILAAFTACKKKEKKDNKIANAEWLVGNWENNLEQGRLSETWEKANDSTLNGKSYFIKDKDTLHNEAVMLTQKGSDLFYIATVKGQNNDEPVIFKLIKANAKQLVFENSKHDFPQKITYTQINKDSLVAEISGVEGGKSSTETYPMKRN